MIRNGVSYAGEGMFADNIFNLFNTLIKTANEIPESEFGKKMVGFEKTMRETAVDLSNKVTNEDLSEIKNLKNTVPNFLLGGGTKPTVPTNIIKNLKDKTQTLLPVMTQTFNAEESPLGDLKDTNKSFGNPDLSPESFDNDLNQATIRTKC